MQFSKTLRHAWKALCVQFCHVLKLRVEGSGFKLWGLGFRRLGVGFQTIEMWRGA